MQPYSMKKADVWSIGVTLYIFTYNRFPYEFKSNTDGNCMTEIDILESISNFSLNFPSNGRQVSQDLKDLLAMMLAKEPEKRLDIGEIKAASRFLNEQMGPSNVTLKEYFSCHSSEGGDTINTSLSPGMKQMSSSSLLSQGSFNNLSKDLSLTAQALGNF
jgi:serine/threonine protein kinase